MIGALLAAATLTIVNPWSRPAVGTGVVYATVINTSAQSDRIVAARSPVAAHAELHESVTRMGSTGSMGSMGSMSSMHPVAAIVVPAHGRVVLQPGRYHVMLIGLKHDLRAGTTFPLAVDFARAGWITTLVHVRSMDQTRARAQPLIPVHGFVLGPPRDAHVLMRLDRVVDTQRGGDYVVANARGAIPPPGTEVDALVTRGPTGLAFAAPPIAAQRFIAGTPNPAIKRILTEGKPAPVFQLVDQRGRPLRLDRIPGKVTILSFVFSRCPDATICPAISSKFLYLQHHLDPQRFHLVEVTLDPSYDSPAVLAAYGRQFDADPAMWSLASGEASQVKDVMDSFGLSSFEDGTDNYIHDVRLVLIDGHGIVRTIVQTAGWNPDDVAATAHFVGGLAANPLRLFWFATIANVIAFCGGNQSIGSLLFVVSVIGLMCAITIPLVVWWGRRVFAAEKDAPTGG